MPILGILAVSECPDCGNEAALEIFNGTILAVSKCPNYTDEAYFEEGQWRASCPRISFPSEERCTGTIVF